MSTRILDLWRDNGAVVLCFWNWQSGRDIVWRILPNGTTQRQMQANAGQWTDVSLCDELASLAECVENGEPDMFFYDEDTRPEAQDD